MLSSKELRATSCQSNCVSLAVEDGLLTVPPLGLKHQFALLEVHRHAAVVGDVAGQQLARERGLKLA